MKLAQLSKPQWDAARAVAQCVRSCNPHVAEDRAKFRAARDALVSLLPECVDDRDIVSQAVSWESMNDFAAAFAGLPVELVA